MKKITPETALKRAAVQLLKMFQIKTWAYPGGVMGVTGFPDRVGIVPGTGQFMAIEFKSERGKLSEPQEAIRKQIVAAGGLYIVCRKLEDLQTALNLPCLFKQ